MAKRSDTTKKPKKLKRYQYERYAILCRLAYPKPSADLEHPIAHYQLKKIYDRHGRTIASILWLAEKEEIIIVFRGSLHWFDWLINLAFWPKTVKQGSVRYAVHAGYHYLLQQASVFKMELESTCSVEQAIMDTLSPLFAKGKRVSLTGHSSGGAMAVLLADRIERQYKGKVKRVVTFGQPSAGMYRFKQQYLLTRKTYRICCDLDVVTFLPPLPLVYWHVGRMLWLHDDKIYENTKAWYRFSKSVVSWLLLPLTYHNMRKYIRDKDLFDEH